MLEGFQSLPVPILVLIFIAAAAVIAVVGTLLTGVAVELASQTGIGQAITGGFFLGATTSLPGLELQDARNPALQE